MSDFQEYKIKEYDNWDLFAHKQQYPYIGRCYAWAKRPELFRVMDMTMEESHELFKKVLPEWENMMALRFNHDHSNIAAFGNTTPHLHWHFIPRYKQKRVMFGTEFEDPRPNGNYAPYDRDVLSENQTRDIIRTIKATYMTIDAMRQFRL